MKLKNRLRLDFKKKASSYNKRVLKYLSKKVVLNLQVVTSLLRCRNILGFIPYFETEPIINSFFKWCFRKGLKVYLPRCVGNRLLFTRVNKIPIISPLKFKEGEISRVSKGVVLVPGVAFDKFFNRLGRGSGFYDRFLDKERRTFILLGVGYSFQIVNKLPVDPWDVRMDGIITDSGICVSKSFYDKIQQLRY